VSRPRRGRRAVGHRDTEAPGFHERHADAKFRKPAVSYRVTDEFGDDEGRVVGQVARTNFRARAADSGSQGRVRLSSRALGGGV
jgi:hypothetical protein